MLGMLLLQPGRPVSQDQLIDAVWGEATPASAVAMLHSCVYRIRKALDETIGGAALRRGASGYLLDVSVDAVDGHRFEQLAAAGRQALDDADHQEAAARLRAALGLWHGAAFAGIEAAAVRERAACLDELRLDATQWCLAAELELGGHQAVLGELEGLVGEHPYREGLWGLLMTALYRSGRQAAALETYQRLYRLLDDELGIQPSRTVRDLQQRILAGAPDLEAPAVAGRGQLRVVPRMLPARVRDFTGRDKQLKLLHGLLAASEDGAMPIAAVAGAAGVGKTALAVHWAHQVADRFRDGQLYVDLRGFSLAGHPLPVGEVVRRFLDALGVPAERVPAALDAQTDLYRSMLADRKMLVVLDNAVDEDQVRPLLPASVGCMVLVTSRSRLQGLVAAEAAYPIGLGLLSDADAELLLVRRLGYDRLAAEPSAVGDLVERCARLPLALAIVAARAATSPDFSLRSIAAQLGEDENLDAFSGTDPVTDLRVVFSWSLDQVTPAAARLFRLLGLDPGTEIGVPATASLAGVPVEGVRPLLAELCDAHLLIELTPGRYVFHDLLCAYAYELATTQEPEADQRAATRRILDHYLHTAYLAAKQLDPHRGRFVLSEPGPGATPELFADRDEAWEWFETERATLIEAVEGAAEVSFDVHVWQLAWALGDFLYRNGHWQDQAHTLRLAVEAGRRLADPPVQARAHRILASALGRLGRLEDALAELRQALALAADVNDPTDLALTTQTLAHTLLSGGRYREALRYSRQTVEQYRLVGDRAGEAKTLNQLGWVLAKLGEYEDAQNCCQQALAQLKGLGDEQSQAGALDSLGYIHHHLGDYEAAVECFEQALALYRSARNGFQEADVLDHLGDTVLAAGDRSGACGIWQQALTILDELGHADADQVRAKLSG
ncbi:BTAD domain-containing putative transcriptional regulator [Flindersiella endophytica]